MDVRSTQVSLVVGKDVTTIHNNAFYGNTSLVSVSFAAGNKLTTIADQAFYSCTALTSIEIPATVTTIGAKVFAYCSTLENVTFKVEMFSF